MSGISKAKLKNKLLNKPDYWNFIILTYFRRVSGCHPLLGCVEEELGGTGSCPKQNGHGQNCGHHRYSGMGPAAGSLDYRAQVRDYP